MNICKFFSRMANGVNPNKTKFMQFRNYKQAHLNLKYNKIAIKEVHDFSFLGITVDKNWNWKIHLEKLNNTYTSE